MTPLPFIFSQAIPLPDNYFWYAVASLLAAFFVFVVGKYYGSIEARFKKSDEKFDAFMETMVDLKGQQVKHNTLIEEHARVIEKHEKTLTDHAKQQTDILTKQTDALTEMLSVMRNWKDGDDDNPTVRRLRNQK